MSTYVDKEAEFTQFIMLYAKAEALAGNKALHCEDEGKWEGNWIDCLLVHRDRKLIMQVLVVQRSGFLSKPSKLGFCAKKRVRFPRSQTAK